MAAVTSVNADYDRLTIGKNLTPQSALTSKLRTAVLCVVFDCCNAYTAGGLTVDLSADGRISTIITAIPLCGPDGILMKYEPDCCPVNCASSGTLKGFEQTPTGCTSPIELSELAACATDFNCQTIKFQITGF